MRPALLVGLLLWALYLLSFGGGPHSPDEIGQLGTTASLVRRGSFDANELFWMIPAAGDRSDAQVEIGPTGDVWSVRGPTVPLQMAPWHALALLVPGLDVTFTTLLSSSLVTALTGSLLVLLGQQLGLSTRAAVAGGLLFGIASMAWPYSRLGFGEPIIGLLTVLAVLLSPLGWLGAAGAGLAVAAATGAKWSAAALAAPIGLYILLPRLLPRLPPWGGAPAAALPRVGGWAEAPGAGRRTALVAAAAFGAALTAGMAVLGWHNLARFGSPFSTGYELAGREQFSTDPLYGLLGLTLSPYRGLLWFWPAVVAVALALPAAWRRAPWLVALSVAILGVTVATFAGWRMWWGGNAWGPRFLLPALPLLALILPLAWPAVGRAARAATLALVAVSTLIQLPGVLFDFNVFERELRGPLPDFPRAGSLFDPRAAQIVDQTRRLAEGWPCSIDLVWARCGAVDWPLAAALLAALALAAAALSIRQSWLDAIAGAAVLVALAALLLRGPTPPTGAMADLVAAARARDSLARPGDGLLVLASPEVPALWSHDRWRGAVYGLNRDDVPRLPEAERMLILASERHSRLWLIAANVPRDEALNGVDPWLEAHAFAIEERAFGAARLRLFRTGPPDRRVPELGELVARFASGSVELASARLLDQTASELHPPRVELAWRLDAGAADDISVFVHLYAGGQLVGQSDVPLARALPRDADPKTFRGRVWTRHAPALNGPVDGELILEVGLYRSSTGERLPARRPDGGHFEADRVPLGRLSAAAGRRAARTPRAPSRPARASTRR